MSKWKDKVAVITGAGSGIGAGLAGHALEQGMVVYGADVDEAGLAALASDTQSDRLHCATLDVTREDTVDALAERVFTEHGQVNLLFNNAGVLVDGKSWERTVTDWRWILEVNVMGVVNGIRAFVPRMLAQGASGRVVNTSSIGGLLAGGQFMAPYQGTKHCVTAISESLYRELALESAPVTASVLCPGEVATDIWRSDRLRTETEQNILGSAAEQAFHDAIAGSVDEGMSPKAFAALVFAGIEADRFWLIPQKDLKPLVQVRYQGIEEESNPETMAF